MAKLLSDYSPLFTSGLLSDLPDDDDDYYYHHNHARFYPQMSWSECFSRRGSLPTLNIDSRVQTPVDESSSFYFAKQAPRDEHEFRSFLSLDLAESRSLRSVSERKRDSCKSSPHLSPAKQPLGRRASRDSLPQPKPIPSSSKLPSIPSSSTTSPRHSASSETLLPLLAPVAEPPSVPARAAPVRSHAPSPLRTSTLYSAYENSGGYSFPPSSPSIASAPKSAPSIISEYRVRRRNHALQRLEGRSHSIRKHTQRNFVSLSDDEEDSDAEIENIPIIFGDSELHLDLLPLKHVEDAPMHPATYSQLFLDEEEEDIILPRSPLMSSQLLGIQHQLPLPNNKRQENTVPMASFIDFGMEDERANWSWRSSGEITGAA